VRYVTLRTLWQKPYPQYHCLQLEQQAYARLHGKEMKR
jgi:hypothetical protein